MVTCLNSRCLWGKESLAALYHMFLSYRMLNRPNPQSRGRPQAVPASAPQVMCRGSCFFLLTFIIFIYVCVWICRGERFICLGVHSDPKRILDPLKLDLQVV